MKSISGLQQLGRALMLPIAVLPLAGILLRIGQPDVLNAPFVAAAGDAVFSNLGLLFAVGVAVGFARENHGAAGLAGLVCFLVATKGAEVLVQAPPDAAAGLTGAAADLAVAAAKAKAIAKLGVPAGILSGLLSGWLYNRYSDIRLPDWLAFFGGRRFVPIAAGLAGVLMALGFGLGFPQLERGLDVASRSILASGDLGLFAYGALNRLLIVTGLHHILNNLAWFILGDFHGVTGDLKRFFAGDPSAGAFMAGFFPVMMFGLPAACLAMYHAAPPERRKAVGGMLLSMAATSFLTGVTEPIEFTFMFLAPLLYLVHAALTGLSMVIMHLLDVKLGFGFSAGLFDYVLNFDKATRPLWLLPVGAVYFAVYYGLFRLCISVFGLKTPGREPETEAAAAPRVATGGRAQAFVDALGGPQNLAAVDACTTRLRLVVRDQKAVDAGALKALGARGIVRPSDTALQVVLGPTADQTAGEIRARLAELGRTPAAARAATATAAGRPAGAGAIVSAGAVLAALGGKKNLREAGACERRVRLVVRDGAKVDEEALKALGARAVARPKPDSVHLILGGAAERLAEELSALI
jgi:PTS system N-acetylglucosamine-specific IIC component